MYFSVNNPNIAEDISITSVSSHLLVFHTHQTDRTLQPKLYTEHTQRDGKCFLSPVITLCLTSVYRTTVPSLICVRNLCTEPDGTCKTTYEFQMMCYPLGVNLVVRVLDCLKPVLFLGFAGWYVS